MKEIKFSETYDAIPDGSLGILTLNGGVVIGVVSDDDGRNTIVSWGDMAKSARHGSYINVLRKYLLPSAGDLIGKQFESVLAATKAIYPHLTDDAKSRVDSPCISQTGRAE